MKMVYQSFGAVIPAYNEQEHIGRVIDKLVRYLPRNNIIVVDDGSTDKTTDAALEKGVRVITHSRNYGKGATLKTGFQVITGMDEVEAVFVLDADGQHDPDEIPSFVSAYQQENYQVIIGNRMCTRKKMPLIRKLTNRLTSCITSLRAGCKIDDSQSGYRLISVDLLKRINLVTDHYETESELLIKASRNNAAIGSVPIKSIYEGETSTINPLRDTLRFLVLVFRSFFW